MLQAKTHLPISGDRARGSRCTRALSDTGTALCALCLLGAGALADSAQAADAVTLAAPAPTFSLSDLFAPSRTTLLGDAGGLRPALAKYGITFTLFEESEVFGNATGGYKRGADYDGVTTPTVMLDTSKAFGWPGGTFEVSGFQIHGANLSTNNLGALQSVSGLEADPSTRLWELWYLQTLGKSGWDVKIGQQSLDQEFITSAGSLLFLNTMMGWPLIPSVDLYAGGPAYPLSSLGIRLHGQVAPNVTALIGVFNDNPPGGPFNDDSQLRGPEKYGVRFNLNTGALVIGELQYALNPPPSDPKAKPTGLPGTYKLGFWYDTAAFPDQRYDTNGLPLAVTGGPARLDHGNYGFYGIFDQVVWQPDLSAPRALGIFARVMGAPLNDRNLISFSVNAGVTLKAPFKGRDGDIVGLGAGYGLFSSGSQGFNADTAAVAPPGTLSPIKTSETFIEAFYTINLATWWQLTPDFQYIFNPGGGIVNPSNPTTLVHDEAVFGARTTIAF
ncbi:MAG: carbohydrate porin [Methylovirgula sp.]|nr:carbohydrate porin [Methylovirgula sp.]